MNTRAMPRIPNMLAATGAYGRDVGGRALSLFWMLVRIMVPIMLAVRLAEEVGLVDVAAGALGPLMAPVGLPPEAALPLVANMAIGPPAGLAALAAAGTELTVAQATVLASMMLIAHAVPLECAIVRRAGGSFWGAVALRIGGAFVFGAIVHASLAATGALQGPADLSALSAPEDGGWAAWVVASLWLLLTVAVVLFALLVLLDAMKWSGVTALFTRVLRPVLRLSGLTEQTTPLVTVGLLLGLTYGGGLIIREVEEKGIPRRARILCLSWLSLSHSIIEDTALMLLMGANLWIIVFGRIAFTLAVVRLIALAIPDRLTAPARME